MSLFHRTHQPRTTHCNLRDASRAPGRNTAESLKNALQHSSCPLTPAKEPATPAFSGQALLVTGLAVIAGLAYCASRAPRIPAGIQPVESFNLDRYLGQWYEVARIDHGFEKGLQRTQAEYSRLSSGCILVTNRGYDPRRGEWRVSHGKARPTIASDIAAFKVSFFGPFYGGYNVVALDPEYRWAMVVGSSLEYFWILSRTPTLPDGIEERLMQQAHMLGIDTAKVLWVHQDGVNPTGSYQ